MTIANSSARRRSVTGADVAATPSGRMSATGSSSELLCEPDDRRFELERAYTDFLGDGPLVAFRSESGAEQPSGAGRRCLIRMLEHTVVQCALAMVILANAVVMGFETDNPDLPCWDMIQHGILLVFTLELVLRLQAYGGRELFNRESTEFWWNIFDVAVVLSGMLDALMSSTLSGAGISGSGHLATGVRCIRLTRVLRVLRLLRFLRRLFVLAYGFLLAAIAVFWVTFLMAFALYVCSIVVVGTLGDTAEEQPDAAFLRERFGSVSEAMFSLFMLLVNPDLHIYRTTMVDYPLFTLFVVFFVIFGSFGMIALLTGVISEAMFEKNILRSDEKRREGDAMLKKISERSGRLFDSIKSTGEDQEAARSELLKLVPKVAKIFEDNGLPYTRHDLVCMLKLMDTDGSGTINRAEFIRGVLQIAEEVRPVLIMELHYDSLAYFKRRMARCDSRLALLKTRQSELADQIRWLSMGKPLKEFDRSSSLGSLSTGLPKEPCDSPFPSSPCRSPGRERATSTAMAPDPIGLSTKSAVAAKLAALLGELRSLQGKVFGLSAGSDELAADIGRARAERGARVRNERRARNERLSGVSARVGQCEFALRQAANAVASAAGQTRDIDARARRLAVHLGMPQDAEVLVAGAG